MNLSKKSPLPGLRIRSTALLSVCLATATGMVSSEATAADASFRRVANFIVADNHPGQDTAAAEIATVADDGHLILYTEGEEGSIGLIDITDPANPEAAGSFVVGGSPTSVAVVDHYALVAVDTSPNYVEPSGFVEVVDLDTLATVAVIDVGGQPDAVAISPDGTLAAIAIENERDEDLDDGIIPQLPAGHLAVIDLTGSPSSWAAAMVSLAGLADIAPSDPEPEFVSINDANEAIISLQENNHLALVDLERLEVIDHFSAGAVDLFDIDATEDGLIRQVETLEGVRREPDAVAWINNHVFATANEGDYEGGSRGFSLFDADGSVLWDAGSSFDHLAARIGHYNDDRSENKGSEPESVAYAQFDGQHKLFVGSERGNFVAIYRLKKLDSDAPKVIFEQVVATGVGPEGLLPIPERNLLVVAAETDEPGDGFRSLVSIYANGPGEPAYPGIAAKQPKNGAPIPWGAMSGLASDRRKAFKMYGVHDSAYGEPTLYVMNTKDHPIKLTKAIAIKNADASIPDLDLEGICVREKGGFWLASEGKPDALRDNELVRVGRDGVVREVVKLPGTTRTMARNHGFEGVSCRGTGADERVFVAFQRGWNDEKDASGRELARIGVYSPKSETWGFYHYPLEPAPEGAWVGLSELYQAPYDSDVFAVIERDNQQGPAARIKRLYLFSTEGLTPAEEGQPFPIVSKSIVHDLLPELGAEGRWVPDKIEGLTITRSGELIVVSDNDGLDDAVGETVVIRKQL